jgi:hypothetical protein
MMSTSSDILLVVLVATLVPAIIVAAHHLISVHRSRIPRLRLLTGSPSQRAAIVLAIRPVIRELLPGLEAAGLEVTSIALLPTLAGAAGEPLQAQVEQVDGTRAFIIRVANTVAGVLRRPDEIAGALAHELLGLYRDAAAVTIVRQTPAPLPTSIQVAGESVASRKNAAPSSQPPAAVEDEAEGRLTQFQAKPHAVSSNNHGA